MEIRLVWPSLKVWNGVLSLLFYTKRGMHYRVYSACMRELPQPVLLWYYFSMRFSSVCSEWSFHILLWMSVNSAKSLFLHVHVFLIFRSYSFHTYQAFSSMLSSWRVTTTNLGAGETSAPYQPLTEHTFHVHSNSSCNGRYFLPFSSFLSLILRSQLECPTSKSVGCIPQLVTGLIN